tara:strand:- start:555 stop:971 length:417 start_codon:yes stop_codon:yes gene_type:complete
MAHLTDLHQLTRVHYEREQQSLRKLAQQESLIRAELQRLSDQEKAAFAAAPKDAPMRAIGADVIWLGWVGRSKAQLNMALAQILAQKEHHMARVRIAYGKVLVTEELARKDASARRQARSKVQLETAQETALWRSLGK